MQLLMAARVIDNKIDWITTNKDDQRAAIRKLNDFGVLSVAALGSVTRSSRYLVLSACAGNVPKSRGDLNPAHLDFLVWLLANQDIRNPDWITHMVNNGTSLSTIEDITLIPRSTLQRRLK